MQDHAHGATDRGAAQGRYPDDPGNYDSYLNSGPTGGRSAKGKAKVAERFVPLTRSMTHNPAILKLSLVEMRTLMVFCRAYNDAKRPGAWFELPRRDIAALLQISERSIDRAITKLKAAKLIDQRGPAQ
jgi:hypothetical protein